VTRETHGARGASSIRVAVFRPDDGRLADAVALVESLGATPVPDPMLAVEPTGATPADDADYVVFTSKTGVELASDAGWTPGGATLAAIGPTTAAAARAAGWTVDVVPAVHSSAGLVDRLSDVVGGARVEIARSDHGSPTLPEGLAAAGAAVSETVLYRLARPPGAGESAALAARGDLAAAAFSSSLTVERFLDAAARRGVRADAVAGLNAGVVGTIGEPTRETAAAAGIEVDVVPDDTDFEALVAGVVEAAAPASRG